MNNSRYNLQKNRLAAALAALLLLSACDDHHSASGGHDHGAPAAAGQHDDHGPAGQKITHFSDRSELFVEFPALVVGEVAGFAAHMTHLADFRPYTEGTMTVVLAGGSAPEERFSVQGVAVPGIFKPQVTPKVAGERELTLIVDSKGGRVVHELGPVAVHADRKAAEAGGGEQGDEGIAFTKEQQWKIDFAVAEVTRGRVRPSVAATATIRALPDGEAQVVAPAAGIVRATKMPRIGQAVKKGQVLLMLTPRLGGETDQATLDAAAAKARVALEQARRERERMATLFKDEAISEKRLLDAQANERSAQAEFDATEARAAQASGGSGIAIRAPIDGTIADVAVTAGAYVGEGAPIFHLANTGRLWLDARVPESEIGRLGSPVGASIEIDGFALPVQVENGRNARLVAVGGVVDATTRTVPVIFEFANPGGAIRLGMTARAQIFSASSREAIVVPVSAVQDESGTQVVYVQTGGESFERKIVRLGERDGERISILDGLEPGQRVVSRGAYLIRLSTSKTGPSGHAH